MQIRHTDHEFPQVNGFLNEFTAPKSKNKKNYKKIICIVGSSIGGFVLIIVIVLIILFATIPCKLLKCHPKARKCINHPFRPQCICDYGYQGDGSRFCDECGLTFQSQNLRIVGGIEAVPNSWPSAALVVFTYKNLAFISSLNIYVSVNQAFSCGGVLIGRNTLLTAAHCIQDKVRFTYNNVQYITKVTTSKEFPTIESMYKVYLGLHDRNKINQPPAIQVSVKKVYRHENYDQNSNLNDIAIIKLSRDVELNQNIQISCLPNPDIKVYPTEVNISSYAVGWGTTQFGNSAGSNVLRNVKLNIYDGIKCKDVSIFGNDWNSQICAGYYLGGKDTCQGDSGGSLYVLDKIKEKFKFVTAGIVSYGKECARPGLPGIYARVSYYSNWIQKNNWKYD